MLRGTPFWARNVAPCSSNRFSKCVRNAARFWPTTWSTLGPRQSQVLVLFGPSLRTRRMLPTESANRPALAAGARMEAFHRSSAVLIIWMPVRSRVRRRSVTRVVTEGFHCWTDVPHRIWSATSLCSRSTTFFRQRWVLRQVCRATASRSRCLSFGEFLCAVRSAVSVSRKCECGEL